MAHVLVKFSVESYAKWRPMFNANESFRAQAGCQSAQVFRDGNNPFEILVLFEWDELENARKFSTSPELKAAMEESGVKGEAQFNFLHEV
ncbi:MAG: antibiotic biosynthesis monooxygenase [Dehalococcoidia bacterium]|nr:antibiotic biosynthesis monooxygenase [Dehalococcoidia bacterium]MQG00335.1 hypothetical protein [SAR202 cluster bacterium]|tara:strand:- start:821 stop:1090 length:270 start_codon:yes stop_codon:yes gene_type:complete